MKRLFLLICILGLSHFIGRADEGMWLLNTLRTMNLADMQSRGLEISAEDIYNANGSSIKDAVVIFGGGCTGEIVSAEGLLLTNYHCGYGSIQELSDIDHDYLCHGYWAMDRSGELPVPGLTVTFVRHIEDVTEKMLKGIKGTETPARRDEIIEKNRVKLFRSYRRDKRLGGLELQVKDFYGGGSFVFFATETYTDIRLVGTPPSSIGKFGGDTDNWMWPRHTGDFSVFRVYADADGKPASYSQENVPYKSPAYLKISLEGYDKGDFAMVMGFPGSTSRYMTSYEVGELYGVENPIRIEVRGLRQEILREAMDADRAVEIKYASKYTGSSNYWKNAIGMNKGIEHFGLKARKEEFEKSFREWASSPGVDEKGYGAALQSIGQAIEARRHSRRLLFYLDEAMARSMEIISLTLPTMNIEGRDNVPQAQIERVKREAADLYKNYDGATDRRVCKAMMRLIKEEFDSADLPSIFDRIRRDYHDSTDDYVDDLFDKSVFADSAKLLNRLGQNGFRDLVDDPAVPLRNSLMAALQNNLTRDLDRQLQEAHRKYVAGILEMESDRKHYPDANFTIRLSYGRVLPYSLGDTVRYDYYTTLGGVIEKEDTLNPSEFTVPGKLKELYAAGDFGRYGSNGDVSVAFITDNDITGGNSGSPVLNARGELIGLAFDGNWEALSGDIVFEEQIQRCISVDIRYVLFIIDKFAGAGYLLDEMSIVD